MQWSRVARHVPSFPAGFVGWWGNWDGRYSDIAMSSDSFLSGAERAAEALSFDAMELRGCA